MARTPAKKSSAKKPPAKKSAAKPKRSSKTVPAAKKTTKKKVSKSTKTKPATVKAKAKAAKTKTTKAKTTKDKSAAKKPCRRTKEITLNRRDDEARRDDEPKALEPVIVDGTTLERREKVNRRRQIDPTTCERDYSESEVEFMNAMDEYKRKNGRMFPTCSEVLEVIRGLGYAQLSPAEIAVRKAAEVPAEGDFDSQVEAEANEAFELSSELHVETREETPLEETELVD